jgi:pyrimidine operon attenuation protein/uracil phosphoribosyltransferase
MPDTQPTPTTPLLDRDIIARALKRIAHELIERHPDLSKLALVGIPTRGIPLAERLGAFVAQFAGTPPEVGVIDVSMHRDDLGRRPLVAMTPTRLPGDLANRTVVLVDDVLYSGRTVRAAMDAITSFGRPARIQLAVLVDRGHRELPIRADYVGRNLPTHRDQQVIVRLDETDGGHEGVWVESP